MNYHKWATYSGSSDCWIIGYICGAARLSEFECYTEENESLADCAARLLIELVRKNIIKLEK